MGYKTNATQADQMFFARSSVLQDRARVQFEKKTTHPAGVGATAEALNDSSEQSPWHRGVLGAAMVAKANGQ
jgi:hypothetical protein